MAVNILLISLFFILNILYNHGFTFMLQTTENIFECQLKKEEIIKFIIVSCFYLLLSYFILSTSAFSFQNIVRLVTVVFLLNKITILLITQKMNDKFLIVGMPHWVYGLLIAMLSLELLSTYIILIISIIDILSQVLLAS